MTGSPDRLYALLPSFHRLRDAEQGYPLRALLRVINQQTAVIEDDIAQLYENSFIETCADWAVPYIGDLIGYRPVHDAGEPSVPDTAAARGRNRVLIPRREIANTIGLRRAKGTLALLEVLANDVAGWPARAVEFYSQLGWTQHLNHQHAERGGTVDLRNGAALDRLDGPFNRIAHSVDVRRVVSRRRQGCYNIASVGVFVFRLRSYSVTQTPAYCIEDQGPQCCTFSVLGNDAPLFVRLQRESEPTDIAAESNLPVPIRRRALQHGSTDPLRNEAADTFYGDQKSLSITAPDWPSKGAPQPIPKEQIVSADLSDWRYRTPRGFIAVDPVLGRMVFPAGQLPKNGVSVSYQYGFSADIGGGEYQRAPSQTTGSTLYRVGRSETIKSINVALDQWRAEKQKRAADSISVPSNRPLAAVIEITDSGVYTEPLRIILNAGESLQIRAANRVRPVLRLLDQLTDRPDAFSISGGKGSRFLLDGLLVTGRGLLVSGADPGDREAAASGDLCDIRIRHCTLVPGWGLHCDCEPKRPNEPSIELINTSAALTIAHSIIGAIVVVADEVNRDPVSIDISDSVLDATGEERCALGAANLPLAFAVLRIARCTVIGTVQTHAIAAAENSIFMGAVKVGRRQIGCMRFCYVTPGSRTPRRFQCQPDLVEHAAAAVDAVLERSRVRPQFSSARYGTPAYCQLDPACAPEIRGGADDESEIGVFHDLYQPQRAANLRTRLNEYTPAAMEAGIIYGT